MFQRKLFSERINPEQISTIINQEVPQIFTYSNYTHCNESDFDNKNLFYSKD